MKLVDFLRYETHAEELCIICDPWRVAAYWIDHEDLFLRYVSSDLANKEVIKDDWVCIPICLNNGTRITIPAHHIYI